MFFSTVTVFVTHSACSKLIALHFVNSHVLVTCDRPSPTAFVTVNYDLNDIMEKCLFEKLELLYSNRPRLAGCQLLFYVVYCKPAHVLSLV